MVLKNEKFNLALKEIEIIITTNRSTPKIFNVKTNKITPEKFNCLTNIANSSCNNKIETGLNISLTGSISRIKQFYLKQHERSICLWKYVFVMYGLKTREYIWITPKEYTIKFRFILCRWSLGRHEQYNWKYMEISTGIQMDYWWCSHNVFWRTKPKFFYKDIHLLNPVITVAITNIKDVEPLGLHENDFVLIPLNNSPAIKKIAGSGTHCRL